MFEKVSYFLSAGEVLRYHMRIRSIMNSEQGIYLVCASVPDTDPQVFRHPGSVGQRYGSGSFYHQAKIVRKTLISTASKSVSKQKNLKKKILLAILKVADKRTRIRIWILKSVVHIPAP